MGFRQFLTIDFGDPHPPHMRDPALFIAEMLIGFVLLLGVTVFIDKLGTALFHKGFAKPFYIKGHRIHHSIIYSIVPISYGAISVLYFLGYLGIHWNLLWINLAYIALITGACIAIDSIGDKFWPEIRKNVILHHEWVYSIIPAYMFMFASLFIIRI